MASIWRRQPSKRLRTSHFVEKQGTSASVSIAEGFWEWVPPAITETIIAKTFPMEYRAEPITAKELRSRVSGATITKVANSFPQELLKAGTAKELKSKWV